jgi:hypothetical protein
VLVQPVILELLQGHPRLAADHELDSDHRDLPAQSNSPAGRVEFRDSCERMNRLSVQALT